MSFIYLISQNDSNVKRLNEALANFPSIKIIVINVSHALQGVLADYAKNLHPEDLIILDSSGESSQEGISKSVDWARSQKNATGVNVLFVNSVDRIPQPSKLGADVVLSVESLHATEGPSEILRLLYKTFKPTQARLTDDSVELLKVMRSRATSAFVSELFYSAQDDSKTISFDEFGLADRLMRCITPLLWVYLSEALASGEKCQFAGIGEFQRSYVTGELAISFVPDASFAKMLVPDVTANVDLLGPEGIAGVEACFPYLPVNLHKFLSNQETDISANIYLASLLCSVFQTLLKGVENRGESVNQLRLPTDFHQRWIGIFGQAAAFACYYFVLANLSRMLSLQKELRRHDVTQIRRSAAGSAEMGRVALVIDSRQISCS